MTATMDLDTIVRSRDGKLQGVVTGATRRCTLEGCVGQRLGVRWPDGKITWPCTKGMEFKNNAWQIR